MEKEELKKYLQRTPLMRTISLIQLFSFFCLLSSPFVWIWYDGYLAFKIAITGVVGILIMYFIWNKMNKIIDRVISKHEHRNTLPKSKFH